MHAHMLGLGQKLASIIHAKERRWERLRDFRWAEELRLCSSGAAFHFFNYFF